MTISSSPTSWSFVTLVKVVKFITKHVFSFPQWVTTRILSYSLFLDRVSKGVRELPGSFQTATSSVPSGKSLMYFGLLIASGVFLVFIAFTMFLPVMVLMPQKFAICFTLGCASIVGSFFALKGPKTQLAHMFSREVLYTINQLLQLFLLSSFTNIQILMEQSCSVAYIDFVICNIDCSWEKIY